MKINEILTEQEGRVYVYRSEGYLKRGSWDRRIVENITVERAVNSMMRGNRYGYEETREMAPGIVLLWSVEISWSEIDPDDFYDEETGDTDYEALDAAEEAHESKPSIRSSYALVSAKELDSTDPVFAESDKFVEEMGTRKIEEIRRYNAEYERKHNLKGK